MFIKNNTAVWKNIKVFSRKLGFKFGVWGWKLCAMHMHRGMHAYVAYSEYRMHVHGRVGGGWGEGGGGVGKIS